MGNIWGILLQTATVSLVAILILVIKKLMADKLSPRWQYGVWIVLALRILMPADMKKNIFGLLPFWMESWKSAVESQLTSAYSAVYEPISVRFVLPFSREAPVSVTDWLFVLYAVGIVLCALRYLISYLRLRHLLRRGEPVSINTEERIREVCGKYDLKACRAVAVRGLPSAFISGIFRPVLAVPAGSEVDEKVLLHELLHLKYRDSLQSVFWCGLRCLHWFNPLMHYAFDRIDNDMESLCDQRVLERLEGKERRQYGAILLDMANDRYARVPGTSSISNGGRNIARRIEAIVRFKKYPKGMALVSVCIILVLLTPAMLGTAADYTVYYHPMTADELNDAMVMARLNRCTTKAGALDTYAKSLIFENGVYLAMVSPYGEHEELTAQMLRNTEDGAAAYQRDSGWELEYAEPVSFSVHNLKELENGEYSAILALRTTGFPAEDGEGRRKDENGLVIDSGTVLITVRLWNDDGWMVEECEERQVWLSRWIGEGQIEPLRVLRGQGETGTVTLEERVEYTIAQAEAQNDSFFFSSSGISDLPNPGIGFSNTLTDWSYWYELKNETGERDPRESVGVYVAEPEYANIRIEFPERFSGNDIYRDLNNVVKVKNAIGAVGRGGVGESEDGFLTTTISSDPASGSVNDELAVLKGKYYAGVYWDGKLVETIELKEAENE